MNNILLTRVAGVLVWVSRWCFSGTDSKIGGGWASELSLLNDERPAGRLAFDAVPDRGRVARPRQEQTSPPVLKEVRDMNALTRWDQFKEAEAVGVNFRRPIRPGFQNRRHNEL